MRDADAVACSSLPSSSLAPSSTPPGSLTWEGAAGAGATKKQTTESTEPETAGADVAPTRTSERKGRAGGAPATGPQYHGYILTVLIASALTVWAVWGELVALLLLLVDTEAADGAFSPFVFLAFRLLIGTALGLTTWYCWRTLTALIYWAGREAGTAPRRAGTPPPQPPRRALL